MAKTQKKLISMLKSYWEKNPNPNIENCINYALADKNKMDKLKITTKILNKNNTLYYKYLILGKYKYEAKIWGSSKVDFKRSISFEPSKEAYYYLHKLEDETTKDKKMSDYWKDLYSKSPFPILTQSKRALPCWSCKNGARIA